MSADWYVLDADRLPVPTDDFDLIERMRKNQDNWVVDRTEIDGVRVSTVFLWLDHSWDGPPPLLFETLVFGGDLDGEMWRYHTWDEAEKGHEKMVQAVKLAGLVP